MLMFRFTVLCNITHYYNSTILRSEESYCITQF